LVTCPGLVWVAYVLIENDALAEDETKEFSHTDYRRGGFLSLFLTLANVVIIWIASMLMFRLKEVLPIKKKVFWGDLKVARKIYQKKALMLLPGGGRRYR